jgi:glycosyltransferase involved in cell wall biosynthesis
MLTIHILTKNNSKTIEQTLDSVAAINPNVIVGDLGSDDGTADLCRSRGATVYRLEGMRRDEARNAMIDMAPKGVHFYIEPWEVVTHGLAALHKAKGRGVVRVMQGTNITKEARIWDGKERFNNPVFERLSGVGGIRTPLVVYSRDGISPEDAMEGIERWKSESPLSPVPHYYHGCVLLGQGRYDDFLKVAEHYLFMDKDTSMSTVMTRYHYAMVQIIHRRSYKPALQNLNLCLCAKPLMAEFWCLMGDVYYHLLNKFDHAKEFYENAIALGTRRLEADEWPIDFSKYNKYPKRMIQSCEAIMSYNGLYAPLLRDASPDL